MLFNTCTNGDPRSFMYYKNCYYINGTEITLTEEYMNSHQFNGKKLWKYARFDHQTTYNNQTAYFFSATKMDLSSLYSMGLDFSVKKDYATYFVVTASELERAIQTITKEIKLSQEESDAINNAIADMAIHPKKDWEYPELVILWIVYIAVMIGSLIFKEFYIPWIIATVLFVSFRKGILGK